MKTDRDLAEKVLQIYFRNNYSLAGVKNTEEDIDFITNNTFRVIVTEKTSSNGWDGDKEKVARMLEIDKVYHLDFMEVGSWSSEIFLKEFPNVAFNSVNFEFLALTDDVTETNEDW